MQIYDVIIIGGGVSGLACAITLGSAGSKIETASGKKILVIDAGKSHLNMAQLYNVPGVAEGTKGPELLASLAQRVKAYGNVTLVQGTVTSVSGRKGAFNITTDSKETFSADTIVFANGMQTIDVDGIGADVV